MKSNSWARPPSPDDRRAEKGSSDVATAGGASPSDGSRSTDVATKESLSGLIFVCVGVLLFSMSPVLVREAAPFTAVQITFGRMAFAALGVALMSVALRQPMWPKPGEWLRFVGYGGIAALHFLLFIASLGYTTIADSLVLVYTAPVFVTLFAGMFLREKIPRHKYLGLPVAIGGIAILTGLDAQLTDRMLIGNLMALGSAVCFGLYSVAGRRERARYPLLHYAGMVYAVAALWLAPFALLEPIPVASVESVAAIVALGVFPLAIGHTLYNASLRRVHPTYVNLIATQEVVGGIALGAILLGEWPPFSAVIGAAVSLVGVAMVLLLG
jgi:drug/metabolite transporter (DMT)-like permease